MFIEYYQMLHSELCMYSLCGVFHSILIDTFLTRSFWVSYHVNSETLMQFNLIKTC